MTNVESSFLPSVTKPAAPPTSSTSRKKRITRPLRSEYSVRFMARSVENPHLVTLAELVDPRRHDPIAGFDPAVDHHPVAAEQLAQHHLVTHT